VGDDVVAVIAIYFACGFIFEEAEGNLFQAVADDIGHGISLIRLRDERSRADEALAHETAERKALENQLLQADKLNAIAQLTGGLAHDFNNKLGVISGNLQLISMLAREHHDMKSAIDAAKRASDSAVALVQSLLSFGGRQHASSKLVNVPELVKSAIAMLNRFIGNNIIIETVHDDSPQNVIVDPARLEAALTNFIINSRDAMPGGGRIVIASGTMQADGLGNKQLAGFIGKYVFISVEDTGTGIPDDILDRVCEPFFTTKPIGAGTGLGLANAYAFARQSLGGLHIESQAGNGALVKLFLPSAETDEDISMLNEAYSNSETAGSGHILVVEDEDDLRSAVAAYLRAAGYTVVEARTAQSALATLKANIDIDILFSDVILPDGMSGFDLIEDAFLFQPGCRVIMTSGHVFPQYDHSEALKGKYIFVKKPYDFRVIANTISTLLAERSSIGAHKVQREE
jgi:signal transduction histidine kinase/CheY-like chemotaxis protein